MTKERKEREQEGKKKDSCFRSDEEKRTEKTKIESERKEAKRTREKEED